MSKSNYLENAVLDFWLNANAGGFSAPATIYLGLIETADPDDSTINEIASTSYTATGASANQRPPITFATTSGSSFAGPNSDIEFENTLGSAFTVKGFGIWDAATGGNLLYWGDISDKTIEDGDSIRFEASSSITISED
jgi:hypothetical protein